jgi:DNA-binding MarR family transcriptional regulator
MVQDIVRAYGFLTLGTRFKRIGDRLQGDTQRIMDEYGVALQASQYPFLRALRQFGPLTIGGLAEAVGVTQPGATRSVAQLIKHGVVAARSGRDDQRQRVISLTAKGRRAVEIGRREIWPRIEAAVADLCAGLSGPLLDQLAQIEDGLSERPLGRRPDEARRRVP